MLPRVLALLALLGAQTLSQEYNLTLFGKLSPPAAPLVVDGSIIVMMSLNTLQGFPITNPTVLLWTFMIDDVFCCTAVGRGSESSVPRCGTAPGFNVIRGRGTVLVSCGPFLAVLNTTTGANVSAWYTIPDGEVIVQVAVSSTLNVALVSLQSFRVFALNMTTWERLWHINASTLPPLVATTAEEQAVVFSFTDSFIRFVDGYSIVTGSHLWNVKVVMSGSRDTLEADYPGQSKTVFVWCGPSCATLRMVYIPTGAYHQWIPDSTVQYAIPTDSGLVVAVMFKRVTVINARTGAVSSIINPGFDILSAVVAFGDEYVTLSPPTDVSDHVATTVYRLVDGTRVGNCGYGICSQPCVTQSILGGTVAVVANCTPHSQTAVIGLLDVHTSNALRLANTSEPLRFSGYPAPVCVQALTNDLVAVITTNELQYIRVTVTASPPSSSSPSSAAAGQFQRPSAYAAVAAIGAAVVVFAFITVAVVRKRRRAGRRLEEALSRHIVDDDDGDSNSASSTDIVNGRR